MTKLYKSLALAGALATGLSMGAFLSDPTQNIEGDGIQPANSITSRLLGINRFYYCERNPAYHPLQSQLDEDRPWICDFFASVDTEWKVMERNPAGYPIRTEIRPEQFKHKVAKAVGPGLELGLGLGMAGLAFYMERRKR